MYYYDLERKKNGTENDNLQRARLCLQARRGWMEQLRIDIQEKREPSFGITEEGNKDEGRKDIFYCCYDCIGWDHAD